jgi:hypothetical protein
MKYFLILFTCISTTCFSQPADLWNGVTAGPHTVGFKVFYEFDETRPALKEQQQQTKSFGRSMQVSIWYPANVSSDNITMGDYLALKGNEVNFVSEKEVIVGTALKILATEFGLTENQIVESLFPIKMKSANNSKAKTAKFPVAIMIHNNAAGYSLLAELLATHGFIVAVSPMTGTVAKEFDWQTTSGVETEVADLEFVLKTVQQNFSNANLNSIGVVGYSYGAMAAVAFAMRHDNVKAVISLDGGIGSLWGGHLLSTLKDYDLTKINKPLLHLWSDLEAGFDLRYIRNYNSATRYIVRAGSLEHNSFVTDGPLSAVVHNKPNKQERIREHQKVCNTSVLFLNQELHNTKANWNVIPNVEILKKDCNNC